MRSPGVDATSYLSAMLPGVRIPAGLSIAIFSFAVYANPPVESSLPAKAPATGWRLRRSGRWIAWAFRRYDESWRSSDVWR